MPETDAATGERLIQRLASVDRERPRIDRARGERAFRSHFAAIGFAALSVRWVRDAEDGYLHSRGQRDHRGWSDAVRASGGYRTGRLPILWARARDAAWTDADRAARLLVEAAVTDAMCSTGGATADWLAARSVGAAAARAVVALANLDAPASARRIWMPLLEAYEAGAWLFWVVECEVIVAPRPAIRFERGLLHAADGPAVSWPSGAQYFVWYGVRVPERAIIAPASISAADIVREPDVDARRSILDRLGYDALCKNPSAYAIQRDRFGTLYRVPLPFGASVTVVEVLNSTLEPDGTRRRYLLRVPPGTQTAHEAVAWTFGMRPEEYRPHRET
jgi:hypothetical protein